MITLGYSYFNTKFNSVNAVNRFYRMEISNGIFDEIHTRENSNIPYSTDKQDWQYDTVMLAKFQNSLEAGSIDLGGLEIEKLKFRKRRIEELQWTDVAEVDFNPDVRVYIIYDRYVEANQPYEYSIVPITSTVTGKSINSEMTPEFDGIWLTDKASNYQLLYNLEQGDVQHNSQNAKFEPLDSKYPIIVYSNMDYVTSSIKAMVVSPNSMNGQIDKRQEKLNRDNWMKFLKNHKPKLLRGTNGDFRMITVTGNPREIPNNNLNGYIAEVDFEVTEIDEITTETLIKNGFI